MAWIELHQGVWTHPKTFELAGELDIKEIYAAAHLIHLWTWAVDNADDGDLSRFPALVIAKASGWEDDPDLFVGALIKCRWLDQNGDRLKIHNWYDYAGKLIETRKADAERKRTARKPGQPKDIQRTSSGHPADGERSPTVTNTVTKTLTNDLRSAAATTIDPTVAARSLAAVEAAAAAEDEIAIPNDTGVGHTALNRIEGCFAQITGRLIPSPLDMQQMRESLVLCRGDAEFVAQVMGAVSNAYKPRFSGDKIRTFSYFLPAIQEAAALRNARAAPMRSGTSERPAPAPMTGEEQARLAALTDEILAALPPELLAEVDQVGKGGERNE